MKYNEIISKFDAYFQPRKNLTFLRFTFLTARQNEGEKFDEFYTRLRKLSEDCEFGTLRDSLIKDLIIIDLYDKKLQEHLLRDSEITLDKVLVNSRASEASKQHTKSMLRKEEVVIPSSTSLDSNKKSHFSSSNRPPREIINSCKFCSGAHPRGACPAYSKICNNCHKKGHFAKCCTKQPPLHKASSSSTPKKFSDRRRQKKVREIQESASSDSDDEFFFGSVEIIAPSPPKIATICDSDAQADQNPTVDNGHTLHQ